MATKKSGAEPMDIFYIKPSRTEGGKGFWINIGTGWVNADGSVNLDFDALPFRLDEKGRMNVQLRKRTKKEGDFE